MSKPQVMYGPEHKAGLQTGKLVLCQPCKHFTLEFTPVGDGNTADGNCDLHGPVFALCPFDCPDFGRKPAKHWRAG